jgi:hypothetical protein
MDSATARVKKVPGMQPLILRGIEKMGVIFHTQAQIRASFIRCSQVTSVSANLVRLWEEWVDKMSARDDILSAKYQDHPAAREAKHAAIGCDETLATLFANFVGYAAANWDYVAQPGSMTALDLLNGNGRKSPACGTLREAMMILVKDELGLTASPAAQNNAFLVRPGLNCFDPKVKGNVGVKGANTPQAYTKGCVFSKHFFLKVGNKFFDPCMKAVYSSEDGPVGGKLETVNKPIGLGRMNPPMCTVGTGRMLVVLMNENYSAKKTIVPGFGSTWIILTPKECKDVLDSDGWKKFKSDRVIKASGLL